MARERGPRERTPRPVAGGGRAVALVGAVALTVPGLALRFGGGHPTSWIAALGFGVAVVGSAFLLAWAAEAVQLDVSQGLALALLALIAVLPEYAVDFTFTWKAGKNPHEFAPLALANMTGGNRLLIGVGWSLVVFLAAWRIRSLARRSGVAAEPGSPEALPPEHLDTDVHLERSHAIEIGFLGAATLYSLTLPLKRTLTVTDAVVLVAIFGAYMVRTARAPAEEPDLVGPAKLLGEMPTRARRGAVAVMFVFSAGVIIACADPFADSLVQTGASLGISTFLLVQWLAPLASEAPELLVAALFAWRLNTSGALGALVSSKVNQWTLLVGTLPVVFMVSSGAWHGLPLDALQREELFLTAAQSVFAVAVLANRSLNVREAGWLLGLFLGQFVLGGVLPESARGLERVGIGAIYLVLAARILWVQRSALRALARDAFRVPVGELALPDDRPDPAGVGVQ